MKIMHLPGPTKHGLNNINTNDGHFIVHHILCALHKTKNFIKKLDKVSLDKHDKDEVKEKFKILCYNPNLDYPKEALDIIENQATIIILYIQFLTLESFISKRKKELAMGPMLPTAVNQKFWYNSFRSFKY